MIRSSVGQSRKQAWGKCCSGHRGKGWRHLPSETGGGACPSTGGVQTHPRIATSLPVQGHQPQASVTLKEGWLRAAFPNWQSHPEKCRRAIQRNVTEPEDGGKALRLEPCSGQEPHCPSHTLVQLLLKGDFTAPRDSPCWRSTAMTDDLQWVT